jgi:hypothetical protein
MNCCPLKHFLVVQTGKSQAAKSPGSTVDAPKPSHCSWLDTVWPMMTNVQVHCFAEETRYFMPILLVVSFSVDP